MSLAAAVVRSWSDLDLVACNPTSPSRPRSRPGSLFNADDITVNPSLVGLSVMLDTQAFKGGRFGWVSARYHVHAERTTGSLIMLGPDVDKCNQVAA